MKPTKATIAMLIAALGIADGALVRADSPEVPVMTVIAEPSVSQGPVSDVFQGCDHIRTPMLQFRANALALMRSTPDSVALLTDDDTGATLISGNDFNFNYEVGWEASAIYNLGPCWSVEARYFQVLPGDSRLTTVTPNSAELQYAVPVFTGVDSVDTTYRSSIRSAELNLRRRAKDWLTYLAGIRYIHVNEGLEFDEAPPSTDVLFIGSTNRLYGGQIGAEVNWSNGKLGFEGVLKGGIFANRASAQTRSVFDPGAILIPTDASSTKIAYAVEAGAVATYRLGEHIQVRGGYQVLWLNNIAAASDQMGVNDPILGGAGGRVSASNDVLFHGFILGAEFRW